MKDKEKTEAENAINRKLDALKAAIEKIAVRTALSPGYSPALAVAMRLKEAWKEEDDELSDEQLRIKAAKLLGCNVHKGVNGILTELGNDQSRRYPNGLIPDYDNNTVMAMTLVTHLEDLGYETILINCDRGNLKAVRVLEGASMSFCPKEHLDNVRLLGRTVANVQETTLNRAITRAFITVMEGRR